LSWALLAALVLGPALALVWLRGRRVDAHGRGLRAALAVALVLALTTLAWLLAHRNYYALPPSQRMTSPSHDRLRPAGSIGLASGVAATLLVLSNLAYVVRRSRPGQRLPGSLKSWMSCHVATGLLAPLLVLVHAAMAPRNAPGGLALGSLVALVASGAAGRYLYALVPRTESGRELRPDEVQDAAARTAAAVAADGPGAVASHRPDDLRARLSAWRFLHRWIALLTLLLAGWHILTALRFAELLP
jgi:hypothetical protein